VRVCVLDDRYGLYTDDTNSTLALAWSLVEKGGLDPKHTAEAYGKFFEEAVPKRGYPDTAMQVMKAVLQGVDYRKTGTLSFPTGSFANGGAMRIAPVGVAFRNATDDQLYEAVRLAIISSHVHPEAIDGAWLQAKAISWMMNNTTALQKETGGDKKDEEEGVITGEVFLEKMKSLAKTEGMRKNMEVVLEEYKRYQKGEQVDEVALVKKLGSQFQIRAIEAVPCAFWSVAKHWNDPPEDTLIGAVMLGGDTDTVASMAGGVVGARHGTGWIPDRWFNALENGPRGRDFATALALKLTNLDLRTPIPSS
jgi:poly(ADP-ribose) glycohydrolase ARH3